MHRSLLLVFVIAAVSLPLSMAEGDFPPPPMPKRPHGFNMYCDVCQTMVKRTVPYCQRDEANMDYLPDFCVFNYNKVLRSECDFIVDVLEYAYCPNACEELRRVQFFAVDKICHHPLVNCTERVYTPSPSVSPSPSPSMALPYDCVLCEFILKHAATMCMNQETANKRNIYQVCMERTKRKEDFDHCTNFLNELVILAGTEDPCTMLSCQDARVSCMMEGAYCHVAPFNGTADPWTNVGLDKSGNLFDPSNTSAFSNLQAIGPGDMRPGIKPYHSLAPIRQHPLPHHIRRAGHLLGDNAPTEPVTPEAIAQADAERLSTVEASKKVTANEPNPTPVPLRDIKMQ